VNKVKFPGSEKRRAGYFGPISPGIKWVRLVSDFYICALSSSIFTEERMFDCVDIEYLICTFLYVPVG